jgi:hypothetical protein
MVILSWQCPLSPALFPSLHLFLISLPSHPRIKIIGTRYETDLGLSIPKFSHMLVETEHSANGETSRVRLKPMAFLDSAPVFKILLNK